HPVAGIASWLATGKCPPPCSQPCSRLLSRGVVHRIAFTLPGAVMSPSSDRNLLFGILALQRGFVRPEQLIHSLHAWALTPERCLADFLLELQALTREQRGEIDRLVVDRLSRDGTPLGQPASPLQLRYLREKFHARGGQGEVFRARDT